MEEEISSLKENDTYVLTTLPPDKKCIGGRWVFDVKHGSNNEPKYKARYVAKGFSQIVGADYKETFAPTARITSVMILMQIAVQKGSPTGKKCT